MAQHIITEVGVPGKKERERRHFQEEKCKTVGSKPSGRVYIHPGYGTQPDWKPHGKSIEVKYSSNGPDWESMVRYIPSPTDRDAKHPECLPVGQRSFPERARQTYAEWTYYPDNYTTGKKCFFKRNSREIQHMGNLTTTHEITQSMLYGRRRKYNSTWQKREFPYASPGDKVYQAVEYSPNFHKVGSSRPIVNFGGPPMKKPDTFVPLRKLPEIRREPYIVKERRRRVQDDVAVVHDLSSWKPAAPLVSPDDVRYLTSL